LAGSTSGPGELDGAEGVESVEVVLPSPGEGEGGERTAGGEAPLERFTDAEVDEEAEVGKEREEGGRKRLNEVQGKAAAHPHGRNDVLEKARTVILRRRVEAGATWSRDPAPAVVG
jgi:hypothetical protein